MQRRGHPAGEAERLAKLQSYGILDTEAEQAFDEIVRLAAFVCGTPISAVSLIDSDRQWFKASVGLEVSETARDVALCDHAIKGRETMIVADAHDDERFRATPWWLRLPSVSTPAPRSSLPTDMRWGRCA